MSDATEVRCAVGGCETVIAFQGEGWWFGYPGKVRCAKHGGRPLPIQCTGNPATWGYSEIERIAPLQERLNRALDPDEIARNRAAFNALPWWRKAWLRWRYR